MRQRNCYAHTKEGVRPEDGWEPVLEHLKRVAYGIEGCFPGAQAAAEIFRTSAWGEYLALTHDLGKYADGYQDYLLEATDEDRAQAPTRVDHSSFGALLAEKQRPFGTLLAQAIAGHHGGMPDYQELVDRLRRKQDLTAPYAPRELLELEVPELPPLQHISKGRDDKAFQLAFLVRMTFSALVDADFLATEWFMSPERALRRGRVMPPSLNALRRALDEHLSGLANNASPTELNRHRQQILQACRTRAEEKPGLFSLTVPTGGGKTLSSLAFGLEHATRHGLRRVIYAIPYTSIIEQNAEVFRGALASAGEGAVLEHHANFEPSEEDTWSRLASENWDAPLIVTTNVQMFESLFHNRPGRCRKLHHLADSVIILDEAQMLPVNLLKPTLMALNELVQNYGCTVVLCTATQPAIHWRQDEFEIGLEGVREIIPEPKTLAQALRRVTIEPVRTLTQDALAMELADLDRVLCVVHTKKQARELYKQLVERLTKEDDDASCFFLTTDLCAEHRTSVLQQIRERLEAEQPCRVVSTSLVEAGVDIDFPVVYRAIAGLDSIAQASGRCNREGKLPEPGRVVVFDTGEQPPAYARQAADDARAVMRQHKDLLSPRAIEAYFREHYWQNQDRWDHGARDRNGVKGPVMSCFSFDGSNMVLNFRTAAERYQLITDSTTPVVVPWNDVGRLLVDELRSLKYPADHSLMRRCQRLAVQVRSHALKSMLADGVIEEPPMARGIYILKYQQAYDPVLGLHPGAGMNPEWLIEGGV
ncbi:CRISPR-associated endonuclease Cas3'' [Mucisphaera calidilacus]|uniref:CRISPR-associated endonuclease/helicase Cas3 n=1 Tax=Mucisphaera calidilacus TaxID=2527982 RepID=A0A518C082_9BACT|nr:CRISPR-associated endonuclease Cas3'' [Mucisphaera calidilacus]QDU72627.1 CRISPR-associated endonuclease/helicase Cas3 [Mucisphaera calidilacus]